MELFNKNKKEKKQLKISLKAVVLLIFVTIFVFFILINTGIIKSGIFKLTNSQKYKERYINGQKYYQILNRKPWNGQYQKEDLYLEDTIEDVIQVVSYTKYLDTINSINSITTYEIEADYSNKDCNYIILVGNTGCSGFELIDCLEYDKNIIIYGMDDIFGVNIEDKRGYFVAIPTNMPVGTKIEYRKCYIEFTMDDYDDSTISFKPIIYLYPTEEKEISVTLANSERITCSYPKYKTRWNVYAKPNGDLKDLYTGKKLYALYYECENITEFKVENEGFVVRGEDSIKFLEEKLAILGLTEREAEEFIVYWLPKLEANKYNYIRFATKDEINENMPLEINPNPDTTIRVLMAFKGLENPIDVQEQQLEKNDRTGFVAVEWGGTEIK